MSTQNVHHSPLILLDGKPFLTRNNNSDNETNNKSQRERIRNEDISEVEKVIKTICF